MNSVRDVARKYAQNMLMPRVLNSFRTETFDRKIMKEMGDLGLLGIVDYHGMDYLSYGTVAKEIEAVDSGYRSVMSVQSSLVIHPIAQFGTMDQQNRYLKNLASGDLIGCFGLTEPNAGSNPAQMRTTAKFQNNEYILNGSKTWITNAPIADIFIIWAKDENGKIGGYLVEKGTPGLEVQKIQGKMSLRTSDTGSIFLDNVRVSKYQKFFVDGLSGPFSCLSSARFGISMGVVGAGEFCLSKTLEYALNREQFGKPLAANQLIQLKLADMAIEIKLANEASLALAKLKDTGSDKQEIIKVTSMLKRNNVRKMLNIARDCRDILGGNGISDEYHIIRHLLNLETVNTYEGTADIHGLIVGKSITGLSAF